MDEEREFLYNPVMDWHVRVEIASRYFCRSDWVLDKVMPHYDLIVVLGGQGVFWRDQRKMQAARSECFCFRKGVRYQGATDARDPLRYIYVHFEYVTGHSPLAAAPASLLPSEQMHLPNPDIVEMLAQRVDAAYGAKRPDVAADWLKAILRELLPDRARALNSPLELEQDQALDRLCEQIRLDPARKWRISDMSKWMHYSPEHLTALFQKHKSCSPMQYVLAARTQAAMSYLRNSSYGIGRIAQLLGYNDIYAFSKQFRQRTGVTPTQFRRGMAPTL